VSINANFNPPVKATVVSDIETHREEAKPEVSAEEVFPQSVSSGDPSSEGAILWTRIDPGAYTESLPLVVEIATDEDFTSNYEQRLVEAKAIVPEHDYTVKVDLDESNLGLESDQRYYYRFEYGGVKSQIGRCKTLPTDEETPERVQFAVLSCRDYQNGYFGAYHHIAEEAVDYLVDLGDFIYEVTDGRFALDSEVYSDHHIEPFPSDDGRDTGIVHDVRDYRHLYRTYHENEFLQEALERHTRIFTWDDHEFADNIYWDRETGAPRAPGHPYDGDPHRMEELVRDALQAWWEYTPTRVGYDPDAEEVNEVITLYRPFQFGDLVTLLVTDERLYRDQPQRHSTRLKNRARRRLRERLPEWLPIPPGDEEIDQTMLGEDQREWFVDEIHDSETQWTVWANEVLTLPMRIPLPYRFHDAWDGYEEERKRLMREVKASQILLSTGKSERGVRNFVTLTGDMHSYLVGYQRTAYPDNGLVGVELMTPAVTSINIPEAILAGMKMASGRIGGAIGFLVSDIVEPIVDAAIPKTIPNVEFFNSYEWGYSVVTFTPNHCTYRAYSVDKTDNSTEAERTLVTEVRIPEGRIEVEKLI